MAFFFDNAIGIKTTFNIKGREGKCTLDGSSQKMS